jgi:hypothetical protein
MLFNINMPAISWKSINMPASTEETALNPALLYPTEHEDIRSLKLFFPFVLFLLGARSTVCALVSPESMVTLCSAGSADRTLGFDGNASTGGWTACTFLWFNSAKYTNTCHR